MKLNKQISKSANKQIVGMSLLEILVVVAIFAILGVITARSVFLTLQGSKKTESLVKVRENLNYALAIIERQIRNADDIPACPNPDSSLLNYTDSIGEPASFSCIDIGTDDGHIASGSARITNDRVNVTTCSFSCSIDNANNPPSVTVMLEAKDKSGTGAETSSVSVTNQIYLRNY